MLPMTASNVTASSAGATDDHHLFPFLDVVTLVSHRNWETTHEHGQRNIANINITTTSALHSEFGSASLHQHLTTHASHHTTQKHHHLSPPTSRTSNIKMQFSAAILVVAAASVASADAVFRASDFSAECVAQKKMCSYNFGIIQVGNGETIPVDCKASVRGIDGSLPAVTDGHGTCDNSSRTFTVDKTAAGLVLTVSQPVTPSSNQSGSHTIDSHDLQYKQTGGSQLQVYVGSKDFDLE
ncbi:hypothetical protein diail_12110 [Diaporthe ilicicola]|nr:hypothetical protein diail_12110 [Diaporthe ilicicola]